MIQFLAPMIAPIANYFTKRTEAKTEVKKAQIARVVNAENQIEEWNKIQAENSGGSWKDEFWTIIFSIPLVLCFIPDTVQYVHQGFAVLSKTPEWYQNTLMVLVLASVGVRHLRK